MALIVTNRGSAGLASATTLSCAPTSNFQHGTLGVLVLAYDNSGASGADPFSSISDSLGNTWTSRQRALWDPGAASAGATCGIFTGILNNGLKTTDTVSVVVSSAAVAAYALFEVSSDLGVTPVYQTGNVGTGATTGAPTVTTSSLTSGWALIGGGAAEGGDTWAGDADSSNGTWSTQQHAAQGSGNSGMSVTAQSKVVTGTATQTYNPTLTSADCILAWIAASEPALAGQPTHRRFGTFPFAGAPVPFGAQLVVIF